MQYHKIMEKFWLIAAIASFIFAVYKIGQVGIADGAFYLLAPLIAAAAWYMRYYARKRFGKRDEE